jgi:PAS domain S-box-containing protein
MPNAPERLRRPPEVAQTLSDQVLDAFSEAMLLVDTQSPRQPVVLANRVARGLFADRYGEAGDAGSLDEYLSNRDASAFGAMLAGLDQENPRTLLLHWRARGGEFALLTECRKLSGVAPPQGKHRRSFRAGRPPTPGAGMVVLKLASPEGPAAPRGVRTLDCEPLSVLHALTERAYDVILVTDPEGGILFVSGGVANALGFTPAERRAENLFDRVHADDRGALRAQYRRLVSGEIPGFTVEYRVQHKDGSYRWMHASYVAALEDPLIGGIVVNSRDVTERRRLEAELLAVSSRERQRIGRDLHDGLGQELTGVALMLRGLALRLEAHCPAAIPATNEAIGLVNQSIETARSLARGLLPVSADEGGLGSALCTLAKRAAALYGIDVRCRVEPGAPLPLTVADASHLYRIAQEALTNAVRHGHARQVQIVLCVEGERYALTISDDGEGLPAAPRGQGLGLRIMAHRARLLAASLDFVANTPRGTCVRVIGTPRTAATLGMI